MAKDDISKLRSEIDALDARAAGAAQPPRRAGAAHRRAEAGRAGLPAGARGADPAPRGGREPGPAVPPTAVGAVFREVISACRALEQAIRVAYLGPHGTFSEQALRKHFGLRSKAVPCASIDEVFRSGRDRGDALRRGAGGELDRRRRRPHARPAAFHAAEDLRRSGAADPPERCCRGDSARRACGACTRTRSRWRSATAGSRSTCRTPSACRCRATPRRRAARRTRKGACGHRRRSPRRATACSWWRRTSRTIRTTRTRFLVLGDEEPAPSGRDRTSLVMSAPNQPGRRARAAHAARRATASA